MKKVTKAEQINKKNRRKKSKFKKIIKVILLLFLLTAIVYGGVFIYKTYKNGGGISGALMTIVGHDEETKKNLGTINILLLGESGVGDGYKLADSIMICSYNPNLQKASILSVPRDTYVGKRDKNTASQNYLASYKMNAVYRNGTNIQETIECVSNLTGMDLDYYILVDTDAVIKVVDAIGGVTFNVPIDMDYDDPTQNLHIHLKAGEQLINGEKAEQLLRFRHNNDYTTYPAEYGDNDLGRMRTQREFMQETAKQLLQAKNIFQLKQLLDIAFESIRTNIDLNIMKDYIPYIVDFNTENIQTETLPGTPEKCNGIWIYSANKEKTKIIIDELFNYKKAEEETTSEEEVSDKIKIELLNGTDDKNIMTILTQKLEQKGYKVIESGTTSKTSKTTIINRTNRTSEEKENLKKVLGVGINQTSTSNTSKVDFTIIIGKDCIN